MFNDTYTNFDVKRVGKTLTYKQSPQAFDLSESVMIQKKELFTYKGETYKVEGIHLNKSSTTGDWEEVVLYRAKSYDCHCLFSRNLNEFLSKFKQVEN